MKQFSGGRWVVGEVLFKFSWLLRFWGAFLMGNCLIAGGRCEKNITQEIIEKIK